MKISCKIIEDLMPLYCDDICSTESKAMVEGHLEECNKCSEKLDIMKENYKIDEPIIEKELDSQKVIKKVIRFIIGKTTLSNSYIFGILVFWILFVMEQSSWINDRSYRVHEILSFFVFIGMIVILIATVIYIIVCLAHIKKKESVKRYVKLVCLIMLVFVSQFAIIRYEYSFQNVEGYCTIEHKEIAGDACYIYVSNKKGLTRLKCTIDEYERIEVNDLLSYHISYKYSPLSPNKGKLIYIITSETIDNR